MATTQPSLLPDHVLSAVLTLAKKRTNKSRFAFRSHDYSLQGIFSELSGSYPILSSFVFSDSGPEPFSPVLNDSVSRLQLSGLIGRENPDYEVVFLSPSAEAFYDNVLQPRFSAEQVRQLEEIAVKFLQHVKVVEAP